MWASLPSVLWRMCGKAKYLKLQPYFHPYLSLKPKLQISTVVKTYGNICAGFSPALVSRMNERRKSRGGADDWLFNYHIKLTCILLWLYD